MGKVVVIMLLFIVLGGAMIWVSEGVVETKRFEPDQSIIKIPEITVIPTPTPIKKKEMETVEMNIPFTSQAPTLEWNNTIFQDGCEEASVLMVMCARGVLDCEVKDNKLLASFAREQLTKMAQWQVSEYGTSVDTSTFDTANRLIGKYFGHKDFEIKNVESIQDIYAELASGSYVILPTNGKLLFNPNFTDGGPERHNLVVSGYDVSLRKFVTNDPGTRNGEGYMYNEEILFKAIRDYPTGDHELISGSDKRMIVVW